MNDLLLNDDKLSPTFLVVIYTHKKYSKTKPKIKTKKHNVKVNLQNLQLLTNNKTFAQKPKEKKQLPKLIQKKKATTKKETKKNIMTARIE